MADEDVQTPEVTETQETPETPSLLDTMYPSQEPEHAEEPKAEGEPKEEPGEDEAAETQEVELSSLTELAEHFELDPEWVQQLKMPVKVNGETSEASIAELVSSYRIGKATEAELAQAKQKASEIIAEAKQKEEQIGSTLAAFNELLQEEAQAIDQEAKSVDWAKLREDDPAEYSAKKEELRERRQRLEERKQKAGEKYKTLAQQALEQQQKALEERLPEEQKLFIERVPEWSDDAKAEAERPEVVKYLKEDGYSDEDIKVAAYNGKLLALAVKAMRYDKSKSKAQDAAKKRVVKVPKVMKPGSKSKEQPKPNGAAKNDRASLLYGG